MKQLKLSTQLTRWAIHWYDYTWHNPDAQDHAEFIELRRIISELRRRRL